MCISFWDTYSVVENTCARNSSINNSSQHVASLVYTCVHSPNHHHYKTNILFQLAHKRTVEPWTALATTTCLALPSITDNYNLFTIYLKKPSLYTTQVFNFHRSVFTMRKQDFLLIFESIVDFSVALLQANKWGQLALHVIYSRLCA